MFLAKLVITAVVVYLIVLMLHALGVFGGASVPNGLERILQAYGH